MGILKMKQKQLNGEDGFDYINIYSKAMTPLGRSLSNFSDCKITISIGYFRTIEGLIFYLRTFNEWYRYADGPKCKAKYKEEDRIVLLPEYIEKRFIIEAMNAKIYNDNNLKQALKESTLPFVHYYNYSGNKITIPEWDWLCEEWEKIRNKLKNEEMWDLY